MKIPLYKHLLDKMVTINATLEKEEEGYSDYLV